MISLFRKKPPLIILIDDWKYIQSNCYQHQLYSTLENRFQIKQVEFKNLSEPGARIKTTSKTPVLSVMRLRNVVKNVSILKNYLDGTPVTLYDQDPWESFRDDSPLKGSYETIDKQLNVRLFLNTSGWWANYVASRGYSTGFVRMGLLKKYCSIGPKWEKREITVGFQGSVHPYRRDFFNLLESKGHPVKITPPMEYIGFLKTLSKTKIFPSAESSGFLLEGKLSNPNIQWIKTIEAMGRGAFALRMLDEEAEFYQMDDFPAFFGFRSLTDAPAIIDQILSMAPHERNQRMETSVEAVLKRRDWESIYPYLET